MTERAFAIVPRGTTKVVHRTLTNVMPPAAAVWIDAREDGVFLIRVAANGEFAGDTWGQSIEEAKAQAANEFGNGLVWQPVPAAVVGVTAFVLERFAASDPQPRQ